MAEAYLWACKSTADTSVTRAKMKGLGLIPDTQEPESNFEKAIKEIAETCETCGEQKVTTIWREQCSAAMCDICFNHYERAQEGGKDEKTN